MMKVDVLCPLYNAENFIYKIVEGIKKQKDIEIGSIIFPVTESSDNTLEIAKKVENSIVVEIKKEDFSHSLTREKMVLQYSTSDIIIFLSQDVIIENENSFFELAKCIGQNNVIYAFGKQISKYNNIEKYTRKYNFPNESYIVTKEKIDKMQIKAFYSSDAFAAYDRLKFVELGGYDGKKMKVSEDMYYCKKALLNGYATEYCSKAEVYHSHKLTLKQLYKRYYDIGVFFAENPEFKNYKSVNSGLNLAFKIFFDALIHFDLKVVIMIIPDMIARYFGKRKGEKSL